MMLDQLDIHMENNEPDPYFISYTKINQNWIIDSKSKGKTINLLEQNTGEYLKDPGIGKEFLNKTNHKALKKALTIKKIINCTLSKFRKSVH